VISGSSLVSSWKTSKDGTDMGCAAVRFMPPPPVTLKHWSRPRSYLRRGLGPASSQRLAGKETRPPGPLGAAGEGGEKDYNPPPPTNKGASACSRAQPQGKTRPAILATGSGAVKTANSREAGTEVSSDRPPQEVWSLEGSVEALAFPPRRSFCDGRM